MESMHGHGHEKKNESARDRHGKHSQWMEKMGNPVGVGVVAMFGGNALLASAGILLPAYMLAIVGIAAAVGYQNMQKGGAQHGH